MQDWLLQDSNHLHAFYKQMCLVKKKKKKNKSKKKKQRRGKHQLYTKIEAIMLEKSNPVILMRWLGANDLFN